MSTTKLIVAREPLSSSTFRVSPIDLGALLEKVPDSDLHKVFNSLVRESAFSTKQRVDLMAGCLSECANELRLVSRAKCGGE